VDRTVTASDPDEPWGADITYVPTLEGDLYLAVVLDVYSRKVVGGRWLLTCGVNGCWRP
jgi:putative transposase